MSLFELEALVPFRGIFEALAKIRSRLTRLFQAREAEQRERGLTV